MNWGKLESWVKTRSTVNAKQNDPEQTIETLAFSEWMRRFNHLSALDLEVEACRSFADFPASMVKFMYGHAFTPSQGCGAIRSFYRNPNERRWVQAPPKRIPTTPRRRPRRSSQAERGE